jgi:non-haem Fe2+, alpha-ketoglutarate-dependent halogenase
MSAGLSSREIETFHNEGYVAPVRAISAERATLIRERIEEFERKMQCPLSGLYRYKAHLLFPCLNELMREEAVLNAVSDLYGDDLLVWSTDVFIKPSDPAFVSWHQDATYWELASRCSHRMDSAYRKQ